MFTFLFSITYSFLWSWRLYCLLYLLGFIYIYHWSNLWTIPSGKCLKRFRCILISISSVFLSSSLLGPLARCHSGPLSSGAWCRAVILTSGTIACGVTWLVSLSGPLGSCLMSWHCWRLPSSVGENSFQELPEKGGERRMFEILSECWGALTRYWELGWRHSSTLEILFFQNFEDKSPLSSRGHRGSWEVGAWFLLLSMLLISFSLFLYLQDLIYS